MGCETGIRERAGMVGNRFTHGQNGAGEWGLGLPCFVVNPEGQLLGPMDSSEALALGAHFGHAGLFLYPGKEPLFSHDTKAWTPSAGGQVAPTEALSEQSAPILTLDMNQLDEISQSIFSKKRIWHVSGTHQFKPQLRGLPVIDYSPPPFSGAPATEPGTVPAFARGASHPGSPTLGYVRAFNARIFWGLTRSPAGAIAVCALVGLFFFARPVGPMAPAGVSLPKSTAVPQEWALSAKPLEPPSALTSLSQAVRAELSLDFLAYARALAELAAERDVVAGAVLPDLGEIAAWVFTFSDPMGNDPWATQFIRSLENHERKGASVMGVEAGYLSWLLRRTVSSAQWAKPAQPGKHKASVSAATFWAPEGGQAPWAKASVVPWERVTQAISRMVEASAQESNGLKEFKNRLLAEALWSGAQLSWFADLNQQSYAVLDQWLSVAKTLPSPDKEIVNLAILERRQALGGSLSWSEFLKERDGLWSFLAHDWSALCAPRQGALMAVGLAQTAVVSIRARGTPPTTKASDLEGCSVLSALVDPTTSLINTKKKLEDTNSSQSILYLKFPGTHTPLLPRLTRPLWEHVRKSTAANDQRWALWLRLSVFPLFQQHLGESVPRSPFLRQDCPSQNLSKALCAQLGWLESSSQKERENRLAQVSHEVSRLAAADALVRSGTMPASLFSLKGGQTPAAPLSDSLGGYSSQDSLRIEAWRWLQTQGVPSPGRDSGERNESR